MKKVSGCEEVLVALAALVLFVGVVVFGVFFHGVSSGGSDTGYISAVDDEYFGTYTVFLRYQKLDGNVMGNAEANERQYCVDSTDKELAEQLKQQIVAGKRVKVNYQKIGFGFKPLSLCHTSPIKSFEVVE